MMSVRECTILPFSIAHYSDAFIPHKVRKSHQGPSRFKAFECFMHSRFKAPISLVRYFTECSVCFLLTYCIVGMVAAYNWKYPPPRQFIDF